MFIKNCQFCSKNEWKNTRQYHGHIRMCSSNPNKASLNGGIPWNKGLTKLTNPELYPDRPKGPPTEKQLERYKRGHTEETKKKISEIRKKYLKENPDKIPYKLNHSSKQSYPEKYFLEIFQKENVNFIQEYQVGLYSLDFAILDKKIDIEIDGDQHYLDNTIVEHDKIRNKNLENLGWKTIRIRWSDYKKMNLENKKIFIENLLKSIK